MLGPSDLPLDTQVLIVGAGPVGLLLGCLLGERGIRTLVVESRPGLPMRSQAIGITPPSLAILKEVGLDTAFVEHGLCIRDCHVHGRNGWVGTASFREACEDYPFILALPQQVSMKLLAARLEGYACVRLVRGQEFVSLQQDSSAVRVQVKSSEGRTSSVLASFVIGCDGHRSRVREVFKIPTHRHDYGCHFLMGDFEGHSSLGQEAHLYFTPEGAVESFPLPGGLRRWIVQTQRPEAEAQAGFLSDLVGLRSGHRLNPAHQVNQSAFSPWRLDCDRMHDGRVLLCGDAGHVMSPIGGQGMNTGFADAEFAAVLLEAVLTYGEDVNAWMEEYDRCRRLAAATAASRAALGMRLGTWRGRFRASVRDFLLGRLILRGPLQKSVGPWFAMMTLPFNRARKSPKVAAYQRSRHDPVVQSPANLK